MELKDILSTDDKLRIIQELVPGKQITLAHVIASPDPILYTKLGLNPEIDFGRSAIGILTMSPAETAIIAADLATKTSNVDLSFCKYAVTSSALRKSGSDTISKRGTPHLL